MDKFTFEQNNAILSRLISVTEEGPRKMSRRELASRLGIDASNLSKYLTGRLPLPQRIIDSIVVNLGVSKEWLLDGAGVPYPKNKSTECVATKDVVAAVPRRGLPVYDIDVTAGCAPLERLMTIERVIGYVDLPHMNPDSLVLHVSGDSMEPTISNGGWLAIRKINKLNTIFWGQIYVVVLEDYRMVKYLRRHPNDDTMVILHSENPRYDDIDLPREEIQALYLVESIINCKQLC